MPDCSASSDRRPDAVGGSFDARNANSIVSLATTTAGTELEWSATPTLARLEQAIGQLAATLGPPRRRPAAARLRDLASASAEHGKLTIHAAHHGRDLAAEAARFLAGVPLPTLPDTCIETAWSAGVGVGVGTTGKLKGRAAVDLLRNPANALDMHTVRMFMSWAATWEVPDGTQRSARNCPRGDPAGGPRPLPRARRGPAGGVRARPAGQRRPLACRGPAGRRGRLPLHRAGLAARRPRGRRARTATVRQARAAGLGGRRPAVPPRARPSAGRAAPPRDRGDHRG